MPVTAKLSKKFYETFGEEVTNELVNWFNMVDATYKNDLRELNERNFERFDDRMGRRIGELDGAIDRRIGELRGETKAELARLDTKLGELKSELLKWMFGFWVATTLTLIGLFSGLIPTR